MSELELLNNIHPLIKAIGEAINDPPCCFFIKCFTDTNCTFATAKDKTKWGIFLNPDCKNDFDESKIKLIASYVEHDKAEDICEKLNQYNLAKHALKALIEYDLQNPYIIRLTETYETILSIKRIIGE